MYTTIGQFNFFFQPAEINDLIPNLKSEEEKIQEYNMIFHDEDKKIKVQVIKGRLQKRKRKI